VCGPSSTRAKELYQHHSPGEPSGVGEGPGATRMQFCVILAELACQLATQSQTERNFAE
jgi:hypothetical protein